MTNGFKELVEASGILFLMSLSAGLWILGCVLFIPTLGWSIRPAQWLHCYLYTKGMIEYVDWSGPDWFLTSMKRYYPKFKI